MLTNMGEARNVGNGFGSLIKRASRCGRIPLSSWIASLSA
jgi:hypothetical protein